eukprot:3802791-Pyramimonas_sp.AAC.2
MGDKGGISPHLQDELFARWVSLLSMRMYAGVRYWLSRDDRGANSMAATSLRVIVRLRSRELCLSVAGWEHSCLVGMQRSTPARYRAS